jgi:hypothetical protein
VEFLHLDFNSAESALGCSIPGGRRWLVSGFFCDMNRHFRVVLQVYGCAGLLLATGEQLIKT